MAGWPVDLEQARNDFEMDLINLTTESGHLETMNDLRGFLGTPDLKKTDVPMLKSFERPVLVMQINIPIENGAGSLRLAIRSKDLYLIGFKGLNQRKWIELKEDYRQIHGSVILKFGGSYGSLSKNGNNCNISEHIIDMVVKCLSNVTAENFCTKENTVKIATSLMTLVFVIAESVRFHKITKFVGERLREDWAESQRIEDWVLEVGKHWHKMSSIVRNHKGDERTTLLADAESIGNKLVVAVYPEELKFQDLGDVRDAIALLTNLKESLQ